MSSDTRTPEQIAEQFHEAYERLAPSFGYRTREASAKPWSDVPEQNKRLMITVCAEVLRAGAGTPPQSYPSELARLRLVLANINAAYQDKSTPRETAVLLAKLVEPMVSMSALAETPSAESGQTLQEAVEADQLGIAYHRALCYIRELVAHHRVRGPLSPTCEQVCREADAFVTDWPLGKFSRAVAGTSAPAAPPDDQQIADSILAPPVRFVADDGIEEAPLQAYSRYGPTGVGDGIDVSSYQHEVAPAAPPAGICRRWVGCALGGGFECALTQGHAGECRYEISLLAAPAPPAEPPQPEYRSASNAGPCDEAWDAWPAKWSGTTAREAFEAGFDAAMELEGGRGYGAMERHSNGEFVRLSDVLAILRDQR